MELKRLYQPAATTGRKGIVPTTSVGKSTRLSGSSEPNLLPGSEASDRLGSLGQENMKTGQEPQLRMKKTTHPMKTASKDSVDSTLIVQAPGQDPQLRMKKTHPMKTLSRDDNGTILQGASLIAYITTLRSVMLPLLGLRGQRNLTDRATNDPSHFMKEESMHNTWLQYSAVDLNAGLWDLFVSDVNPNIHIHNDLGRRDKTLRRLKDRLQEQLMKPIERDIDEHIHASVSIFVRRIFASQTEISRLRGLATPQEVYLVIMRTFYDIINGISLEGVPARFDAKIRERCTEEFRLILKEVLINQTFDSKLPPVPVYNKSDHPVRSLSVNSVLSQDISFRPKLRSSAWEVTQLSLENGSSDANVAIGASNSLADSPYVSLSLLDMFRHLNDAFKISDKQSTSVIRSELALHGHRHVLIDELRQRKLALNSHPYYSRSNFTSEEEFKAWREDAEAQIVHLLKLAAASMEIERDTFTGTLYISVLDAVTCYIPNIHSQLPFEQATELELTSSDPFKVFPSVCTSKGFVIDVPYPVKSLVVNLWDDDDIQDNQLSASLFNPWAPLSRVLPPGSPPPPIVRHSPSPSLTSKISTHSRDNSINGLQTVQLGVGPSSPLLRKALHVDENNRRSFPFNLPPMDPKNYRPDSGVLEETTQTALFVGDVAIPLDEIQEHSKAGRVVGWFPLTDTLATLAGYELDAEDEPMDPPSASKASLSSTDHFKYNLAPQQLSSNHQKDLKFSRKTTADSPEKDGSHWCVQLEVCYMRNGFKRKPLPEYHSMFEILARKLIQSEVAQYKIHREEVQISVGAWKQYKERELQLASASASSQNIVDRDSLFMPCPTSVVSGNDSNGVYPGALSLSTQCILQEYSLRYGIGLVCRKLTLLSILTEYEAEGVVDIVVMQGLIMELLSLITTESGEISGLTIDERAKVVKIVETLAYHQVNQLVKYKFCFADAQPTGALPAAIAFLRFALNLHPFCSELSKTFPPVNELLLRCVKEGTNEMYERLSAMAMPEFSYNQKSQQGIPVETVKMLELANLIFLELEKDEKYFKALWPFDLLAVTVSVYLKALAVDLKSHFEDLEVEASTQVFDLYFRLKDLKAEYPKHWDSVGGDKLFPISDWFLPFVCDWIIKNSMTTNKLMTASIQNDVLLPSSDAQHSSSSVDDLFKFLLNSVDFITRLELKDEKSLNIIQAKFVQSTMEVVELYIQGIEQRRTHILLEFTPHTIMSYDLTEEAKEDLFTQLIACANNIMAIRSRLPDVFGLLGINERIIDGHLVMKQDSSSMYNNVMVTYEILKLARQASVEGVISLFSSTISLPVQSLIREVSKNNPISEGVEGRSKAPTHTRSESTGIKAKGLLEWIKARNQKQSVKADEQTLLKHQVEEADLMHKFTITTIGYTNIIMENAFGLLAQDILIGTWRKVLVAIINIIVPDECRKRLRKLTVPITLLPNEALSVLDQCISIVEVQFLGAGCKEEQLRMDGKYTYIQRCLADYHRPTVELISQFIVVMDKPLRENEDISVYLTGQESVSHIPDILSMRRSDVKAFEFSMRL